MPGFLIWVYPVDQAAFIFVLWNGILPQSRMAFYGIAGIVAGGPVLFLTLALLIFPIKMILKLKPCAIFIPNADVQYCRLIPNLFALIVCLGGLWRYRAFKFVLNVSTLSYFFPFTHRFCRVLLFALWWEYCIFNSPLECIHPADLKWIYMFPFSWKKKTD